MSIAHLNPRLRIFNPVSGNGENGGLPSTRTFRCVAFCQHAAGASLEKSAIWRSGSAGCAGILGEGSGDFLTRTGRDIGFCCQGIASGNEFGRARILRGVTEGQSPNAGDVFWVMGRLADVFVLRMDLSGRLQGSGARRRTAAAAKYRKREGDHERLREKHSEVPRLGRRPHRGGIRRDAGFDRGCLLDGHSGGRQQREHQVRRSARRPHLIEADAAGGATPDGFSRPTGRSLDRLDGLFLCAAP